MASRVAGGVWRGRQEHQLDDAVGAGGDAGFAVDQGAIVHARGEGDVAVGCGIDAASAARIWEESARPGRSLL